MDQGTSRSVGLSQSTDSFAVVGGRVYAAKDQAFPAAATFRCASLQNFQQANGKPALEHWWL